MTKKQEREVVFNKYNGRCAYCGCELEKVWHIDHKEPLVRDIITLKEKYPERKHIDNLMPSCASCNINKHSLPLESFRNLIKGFMKHLNEVNTQYKIAKRYGLVSENDIEVKFYFERNYDIKFMLPKQKSKHKDLDIPKIMILPIPLPSTYDVGFKDVKQCLADFDGIFKKK